MDGAGPLLPASVLRLLLPDDGCECIDPEAEVDGLLEEEEPP